jgi:hypothetical protein
MSVQNHFKKKSAKAEIRDLWLERTPLLISLFLFAFGIGMIVDGKRLYSKQLICSERVKYHATLNPFKTK